jgi:acetyl-CoA acetyltransferase
MKNIAVVSFAQTPYKRRETSRSEVEMVMAVVSEAVERSGIPKREIGFTCSGSSDYIAGQAFAFVGAVDALGAWPPIMESHVEMDAAWALYEAWVKIQAGYADSALVFGFGRASMGTLPETLNLQLDPYTLAAAGGTLGTTPSHSSRATSRSRSCWPSPTWSPRSASTTARRSATAPRPR